MLNTGLLISLPIPCTAFPKNLHCYKARLKPKIIRVLNSSPSTQSAQLSSASPSPRPILSSSIISEVAS